jgi:hypothetical protein
MPVVLSGKGSKQRGVLHCDVTGCEAQSQSYAPTSPAAPALTVCEAAQKAEGWWFNCDFWAMAFGHTVYCPEHAPAAVRKAVLGDG